MKSDTSPVADAATLESEVVAAPLALRSVKNARGEPIDLRPLAALISRIEERYHPEQIWLFGSRARGDANPWSDWDLFIVTPDNIPESDLNPLVAWRLRKESGVYVDVIPCRVSNFLEDRDTVNTICNEVAMDGLLLYER
jgi:predicted nucleotidyltransferase